MQFDFCQTLLALSYALDCVEHDILGVATRHGKRVAELCLLMGAHKGLSPAECQALAACAVLHDCALTEYVEEEYGGSSEKAIDGFSVQTGMHCISGERHLAGLPFTVDTAGAILYHHENADGSGPLRKTAAETPLFARLIHLADTADATWNLSEMDAEKQTRFFAFLEGNTGILFDPAEVSLFCEALQGFDFNRLRNENIDLLLSESLPCGALYCTPQQLMQFAGVFATIVDYKSHFTKKHSLGIAQKAYAMAHFYGEDEELASQLYFAGALHDIGKLVVDRDILEKPEKLTPPEYRHIQTHVHYTYEILSAIPGLENITKWASHHHEKLDGTGYPSGLTGEVLGKWERLMACLDIYQALVEDRPYKKGFPHARAISILQEMADDNKIDGDIVHDIDTCFGAAAEASATSAGTAAAVR